MPLNKKIQTLGDAKQRELFKGVNKNYIKSNSKLDEEVEEIYKKTRYDKNGKLITKQKEYKSNFKRVLALTTALWLKNGKDIQKTSTEIMSTTLLLFEFIGFKEFNFRKGFKIDLIIREAMAKRNKSINFAKVLGSNSKRLNKRVQKIITKAVKNGESLKSTEKKLTKVLKGNAGKAKAIAATETNFYRSESQLIGGKLTQERGVEMIKEWIYTFRSREPRETHIAADGQTVALNDKFTVGGKETDAPQHFGDPSEDINCKCRIRVTHEDIDDDSLEGFKEFQEERGNDDEN